LKSENTQTQNASDTPIEQSAQLTVEAQNQNLHFRQATEDDIDEIMEIRLAVKENVLNNPARVPRQMCIDYLELLGRGWVCEQRSNEPGNPVTRIIGFSYAAKKMLRFGPCLFVLSVKV